MEGKNERRDIRKEIDALKRKAEEKFRRRPVSGRGKAFLERAAQFGPGGQSNDGRAEEEPAERKDKVLIERLRDILEEAGETGRGMEARGQEYIKLEEAVSGSECSSESGEFYRIINQVSLSERDGMAEFHEPVSTIPDDHDESTTGLEILRELSPEKVCYLDIETTGLKSCPLFLIGLLYSNEGNPVVDQLFARDYGEERGLLEFASGFLQRFSALVTFNGRSFDLPYIRERMTVWNVEDFRCENHLDLLPVSRKLVGARTPNHKLQTLERHLLGLTRIDDTPGNLIPDVYHEFVRTGDAAGIRGIIRHNRIDLVSMVRLVSLYLSAQLQ